MPIESRKSQGNPVAAGALVFFAVGIVVVVGLLWFLVRQMGASDVASEDDGPGFLARIAALFEGDTTAEAPADSAPTEEPPLASDAPTPVDAPSAEPEPAAWPAADAMTSIERVVAYCAPALESMSEGVRLLAADASPVNLDFIQESASVEGRFVRVACAWNGTSFDLIDAGRMIVPPMVGDPQRLPLVLLDAKDYDAAWFRDRVEAAQRAAGETADVVRIETSFVGKHGVLTRVRLASGDVILASDDRAKPADTPFPQVERMLEATEEDALRGYRDHGETNWAIGVVETIDQIGQRYLEPGQRMYRLFIAVSYVSAALELPKGKKGSHRIWTIDHQRDITTQDVDGVEYGACKQAFTLADARRALLDAIKAREETLEEFEAIQFQAVNYDCRDGAKPAWRFD